MAGLIAEGKAVSVRRFLLSEQLYLRQNHE